MSRTRTRGGMKREIHVAPPARVTVDAAYRPPRLHFVGYSPAPRQPIQAAGPGAQITRRVVQPLGDPSWTQGIRPRLRAKSTGLAHGRNPKQHATHKPADKQQVAPISTISTTKSPDLFRVPERDRPLVAFTTDRAAMARRKKGKVKSRAKGKAKGKAKVRRQSRAKHRSPRERAASSSRRKRKK